MAHLAGRTGRSVNCSEHDVEPWYVTGSVTPADAVGRLVVRFDFYVDYCVSPPPSLSWPLCL